MDHPIEKFMPASAVSSCRALLATQEVEIRVVSMRKTRHGDYKRLPNGTHVITLNANPNPYRFLITLLHELAHFKAFENFGRSIKPHGGEWKKTFQLLMLPFLRPEIFPEELLPYLARHFKNPRASSSTDTELGLALKIYDPPSDTVPVLEIPLGGVFQMYNGRQFRKGDKRTKRIECTEITTGRIYLFQPNAEVVLIKE